MTCVQLQPAHCSQLKTCLCRNSPSCTRQVLLQEQCCHQRHVHQMLETSRVPSASIIDVCKPGILSCPLEYLNTSPGETLPSLRRLQGCVQTHSVPKAARFASRREDCPSCAPQHVGKPAVSALQLCRKRGQCFTNAGGSACTVTCVQLQPAHCLCTRRDPFRNSKLAAIKDMSVRCCSHETGSLAPTTSSLQALRPQLSFGGQTHHQGNHCYLYSSHRAACRPT